MSGSGLGKAISGLILEPMVGWVVIGLVIIIFLTLIEEHDNLEEVPPGFK
jgi:hypothetical protein